MKYRMAECLALRSTLDQMPAEFKNVSKGNHENIPVNKIKTIPSTAAMLTQLGRKFETRYLTVK